MQPNELDLLFNAALNYGLGRKDFTPTNLMDGIKYEVIDIPDVYFTIRSNSIEYKGMTGSGSNDFPNGVTSAGIMKQWKNWIQGIMDQKRQQRNII